MSAFFYHLSTAQQTFNWPELTFLSPGKAMPLCAPSRFALFSGRHPGLFGMNFVNIKPTDGISFPPNEMTMPEKFKALGYSTLGFGKVCLPMISLPRYVYLLLYNNVLFLSSYAVASRPCQSCSHPNASWVRFMVWWLYGLARSLVSLSDNLVDYFTRKHDLFPLSCADSHFLAIN